MAFINTQQFEREFYRDVREKKRTASGIHKMRGKRGYVGKVITTMDLLSGRERREYIKPGKVVGWNMYKQLIPFDELKEYTEEQQKNIVEKWRDVHTNAEIMKALDLNSYSYYKYLEEIGVKVAKYDTSPKDEQSTENILTYKEWKSLPYDEQYYLLEDIKKIMSVKTLAEHWGVTDATIYTFTYKTKKRLEEEGKPLIRPSDREPASKYTSKPKVQNLLDLVDEKVTEELEQEENPIVEEEQEKLADLEPAEAYQEADEKLQVLKDELSEKMAQKDEEVEYWRNQYLKASDKSDKPIESEVRGMTFQYSEVKEGFLIHQDVKRFISMLEKNPDRFELKMDIVRVEEE